MKKLAVLTLALLPLIACGKKVASGKDLFTQAAKYESTQEYSAELKTYQTIIDNYPTSPNCYKAMFMIGYIYSDYLKDYKKAIAAFDKFLVQYPNSDLAKDAQFLRDAAASGRDLLTVFQDSLKGK